MLINMVGEELVYHLVDFDKYTLFSYFYATPIQTCIDEGPALLSRAASICLSGGVRSDLVKWVISVNFV